MLAVSLPLSIAKGGDSRIGRLQHLNGGAGAVVGRQQALQQVRGFPEFANKKNGLGFARQLREKLFCPILDPQQLALPCA